MAMAAQGAMAGAGKRNSGCSKLAVSNIVYVIF